MLSSSPAPQRKMKKANGSGNSSGQHIKVFVRVRPMNEGEKLAKACSLVHCPNNKEIVVQERPMDKLTKKFTFDKVFDAKSKQVDIYKAVAKPLVEEVLNGFNCTIFAYGQTGTGKTYTMEGDHYQGIGQEENVIGAGIIPRCVNQLFDELRIQKQEFTMKISFLELYNEEVFDLLSAQDDLSKLRLYEDTCRKGSCIIQGLEEVHVRNKLDVYNIIEKGSSKRQTAATLMNAHSSRSHTVFTVTVHIKENTLEGDELLKTGKLHLVDLAGSENIGRSGAVDKRAREAGNINQSLLTLGRVITSLVEKAPHIPYRESKLTRLLQDALGGRTKTSIIATVSPASNNLEETLSTLDYAHRAKNIQNKPEVNQKLNKKELIGEYSNEIEKLRRDLLAMREKNGVYLANENYQEMLITMEQQVQEISEKISEIRSLEGELEKQYEIIKEATDELSNVKENLRQTETKFLKTKEMLQCTQTLLSKTSAERDEQIHLVSAHSKTESALQSQGKSLIKVAETTISDISKLQDKLDRKRKVDRINEEVEKSFEKAFEERISAMHSSIQAFHNYHHKNSSGIVEALQNTRTNSTEDFNSLLSNNQQMYSTVLNALNNCGSYHESKVNECSVNATQFVDCLKLKSETEQNAVECFLNKVFRPLMTELSQRLSTQNSSLTDLKESIQEEVKKTNALCHNKHKEEMSLMSSMESQLKELSKYPALILEEMKLKSNKFEEMAKSHSQKLADVSKVLASLREEQESFYLSHLPLLPETQQDQINIIKKSSEQVLMDVRHLSEISSKHAKQSLQIGEEVVSTLISQVEEIEDSNQQAEGVVSSISCKVDESLLSTQEFIQQVCESSEEYKTNAANHSEKTKDEFNKQIKEYTDEVSTLHNESSAKVRTLINMTETKLSDVEEKLLRSESELEEFLTDHDDQLKESGESVQAFNKQLAKDVPTGNTPMRKEYPHVTTLVATSPHDTIIRRFRNRAFESKIPLPQFNQDSEEDAHSPPCSSSAATSCNSSVLSESDIVNSAANNTNELLRPLSRSSSFKDGHEFAYPSAPSRQESKEDIPKISISRSSSSSSLTDTKENCINTRRTASSKKREIKPPSTYLSVSNEKLNSETAASRTRKILGSFN